MCESRIDRRGFFVTAGAAASLLAVPRALAADGPRLAVGPVRRVGAKGQKFFEPWIAINPGDATNLVVVGSRLLGDVFHSEPAAWFTTDGGDTWEAAALADMDHLRGGTSY